VRYCNWKSNDMLARSATGDNDLDLLVDRRDAQRFLAVLARLGFRQAVAPGGREHPGVSHHDVLDEESGRLVHIHAQSHARRRGHPSGGRRAPPGDSGFSVCWLARVFHADLADTVPGNAKVPVL
jgi:hypothetical protein